MRNRLNILNFVVCRVRVKLEYHWFSSWTHCTVLWWMDCTVLWWMDCASVLQSGGPRHQIVLYFGEWIVLRCCSLEVLGIRFNLHHQPKQTETRRLLMLRVKTKETHSDFPKVDGSLKIRRKLGWAENRRSMIKTRSIFLVWGRSEGVFGWGTAEVNAVQEFLLLVRANSAGGSSSIQGHAKTHAKTHAMTCSSMRHVLRANVLMEKLGVGFWQVHHISGPPFLLV